MPCRRVVPAFWKKPRPAIGLATRMMSSEESVVNTPKLQLKRSFLPGANRPRRPAS